jgi:uncharacterized protein (DUF1330 family)
MPAYLIVYRESAVRDPAEMALYRAMTRQGAGGNVKLTPRVLEGAVTPLEGQPPESVIMLEFPTVEDAKAWYDSPGYQAALPHRKKAADYRVIIVDGL